MASLGSLCISGIRVYLCPPWCQRGLLKPSILGQPSTPLLPRHFHSFRNIQPLRGELNFGHARFPKIIGSAVLRRTKFDFSAKSKDPKEVLREKNRKTKKMQAFLKKFQYGNKTTKERSDTTMMYLVSLVILTVGASYAAVPLYRIFCQQSGYGGTVQTGHDADKVEKLKPNKERRLTVKFQADTAASMQWNFKPQQSSVTLYAGETALAFYTVRTFL